MTMINVKSKWVLALVLPLGMALAPPIAASPQSDTVTEWNATMQATVSVAVLDVGSATAEAAPSTTQFAGTYDWGGLPITISNGGRISGSVTFSNGGEPLTLDWDVSIRGRVHADGSYSFTRSTTIYQYDFFGRRHRVSRTRSESAGNMALDLVGNIVGTEDTGGSFIWLRQ